MSAASSGFTRYSPSVPAPGLPTQVPASRSLLDVIRDLDGASSELVERNKTIFFPGDPAERVYLIRRGAVRLSRVYESGEEITVALLRENSLFGVLSLLTGHHSDRFYHAVAFTRVEMVTAPAVPCEPLSKPIRPWDCGYCRTSSRILQTETMIETLTHRDMSSRLVSFLLVLCRDFGFPMNKGSPSTCACLTKPLQKRLDRPASQLPDCWETCANPD